MATEMIMVLAGGFTAKKIGTAAAIDGAYSPPDGSACRDRIICTMINHSSRYFLTRLGVKVRPNPPSTGVSL